MANSLVFLSSDKTTPLTSTVIIAKALNRDVREINQMIVRHKSHIEAFGMMITLNDRHIKMPNGGYKTVSDYYLNEMQATFLITLLRNSPKVLDFKLALVKAFFEMRQQLQQSQPKTNSLPNYSTDDQLFELRKKSYKKGFAVACDMYKKDEVGLSMKDRDQLKKIKSFIDWYTEKRAVIHDTWKAQRELAHDLRELTYKLEQTSDLLSLLFGSYVGTLSEARHYLSNLLQESATN